MMTPCHDPERDLLVGELAKQAGVSTGLINFYVQQGLLPRPRKVNRTRAYYDRKHLDRLIIIKRLQAIHGFPLSIIRRMLEQAGDDEQLLQRLVSQRGPAFARDMASALSSASPYPAPPALTAAALLRESGLTQTQLEELIQRGLIGTRGEKKMFGAEEVEAARAFQRLFELGASDPELFLYEMLLSLQQQLAGRLFQHLLGSHRREWLTRGLSGAEVSRLSGTVESYLRFRAASDHYPSTLMHHLMDLPEESGDIPASH